MPRLFVAVWPPESLVEALAALRRPDVKNVRWTKPHRLHCTLRFLGECDLEEATGALEPVTWPAARVALDPTPERLGRNAFALLADGLDELAAVALEATRFIGEPAPDQAFTGHMTVARTRRRAPQVDWRVLGTEVDAAFDVTEVTLVETTPWNEYKIAAAFPVNQAQPISRGCGAAGPALE